MNNLENWNEITKGLYRYVIAANVAMKTISFFMA